MWLNEFHSGRVQVLPHGRGADLAQDFGENLMQTPVRVDFQNFDATPNMHAVIAEHLAELEDRYGRITAGRVVVKGPGDHHRTGGIYDINIRLALPDGREVNVGRTAAADERHSDLSFAVNDAFKRARRQLQDQVRRMRGEVKQHDT
jgi:ribosome-associated translation inhibitor RaiA